MNQINSCFVFLNQSMSEMQKIHKSTPAPVFFWIRWLSFEFGNFIIIMVMGRKPKVHDVV